MKTWAEVRRIEGVRFGRVVYIGTGDSVPIGNNSQVRFIDLARVTPAPAIGWYYAPSTRTFSNALPGALPAAVVSPAELWYQRVTNNERGRIFALAQQDGGGITLTLVQRGRLQAFLAFSIANDTPLDDPEAVFIFGALESKGVIGAGRTAVILA